MQRQLADFGIGIDRDLSKHADGIGTDCAKLLQEIPVTLSDTYRNLIRFHGTPFRRASYISARILKKFQDLRGVL